MKFGGTSVRNKEAIERVVSIVRSRLSEKPLVVVSALAKVTRLLCQIAEEAESRHPSEVEGLLASLRDRHTSLAAELLAGSDENSGRNSLLTECLSRVNALCDSLTDFVRGVCQIGELSPRSYARIVSTGELLSSVIVSAAMNARGISCGWLDARDMVVTDSDYMSAAPDLAATEANVKRIVPEASKGVSVLLTQGFIASSAEGYVSVLGFEGSDYSAAIFGMALDAARVEIWTDVDGIRSADPRVVPDTERIARVSYEEASEMAFLGARVLHPLTIEPARKRNIPVCVLNSMNPSCAGSVVTGEKVESGPKTVSSRDDVDYLEIRSGKIMGVSAMMSAVFREICAAAVRICLVCASESLLSITMESGQPGAEAFVASLRKMFDVTLYRDKAQISVVGKDAVLVPGLADNMLHSAEKVYMMSQSPSLLSSSIVIDRENMEKAVTSLHRALFGKQPGTASE